MFNCLALHSSSSGRSWLEREKEQLDMMCKMKHSVMDCWNGWKDLRCYKMTEVLLIALWILSWCCEMIESRLVVLREAG